MKEKKCDLCGKFGHLKVKCHSFGKGKGKGFEKGGGFVGAKGFGKGKGKGAEDNTCWDFVKTGPCPRGDTCQYLHGEEGASAVDSASMQTCFCCGAKGHTKPFCPFQTKTCDMCGKVGHLRTMCKSAQ